VLHGGSGQRGHALGVQVEQAGSDRVLLLERRAEHRRVVGVDADRDAGGDQGRQRVLVERGDRAGADVGGRADLERDAAVGQVGHEHRVLRGRDAVADALGAEHVQRVPDGLRAGGLAGVRDAAQAGRPGPVEDGLELGPGYADLGPTQTETDQAVGLLLERDPQGLLGRRQARLARDVEAPAQLDAELVAGAPARVLDRRAELRRRDAPLHARIGRDGELGVPHLLAGQFARHLEGQRAHVLIVADQVDHAQIDVDEVPEIAEREVVGQRGRIGRHRRVALVPGGQLGHDPRRCRAHVVDVQLNLGQPGDERRQLGHDVPSAAAVRATMKIRRNGNATYPPAAG
jgi:hypothetical protein